MATGTGDNGDQPPGLTETGLTENTRAPRGCIPGDPRAVRYDAWPICLDVVAPPLHVYKESRERGPVDNMRAPLWALAVADRGDARQVGCYLDASPVVRA